MKSILLVALLLILMGCTTSPASNVTVVNDTTLDQPTISPSGYVSSAPHAITISFDEPAIITGFKLNNITKSLTRVGGETYSYNGTFPDGSYAVSLSAEDAAGNKISYSNSFVVDTTAPTVTVDPENNEQVASSDVTITLAFSEPVALSNAKLGSNALAFATTDNTTFTAQKNLNDGSYTVSFTAADRAGNSLFSNTTFTVNIATPDRTAPPQITGLNATNTGNGGEVKLVWDESTVNDFKEYRIYKSSSELTSVFGLVPQYTVPYRTGYVRTIKGLTNGAKYCFAVTAVDNSNNELGDVIDACIIPTKEDKVPPSITGHSPTGTVSTTNTPTISATTDEDASCRYKVSTNDSEQYSYSDLSPMSGSGTAHTKATAALSNGTYTAYVICKDTAGNTMDSAYTWDFTVAYADTTAPVISSVSASTGKTYAVISWTTDEAGNSSVSGNFTGGSSSTMETSHSINITGLAQGTAYGYNVTSCDASGNCATSTTYNFTTSTPDTVAPVVTINTPANATTYNTTSITLNFTVTDDIDTSPNCSYSLNNTANISISANGTVSLAGLGDGDSNVTVYCEDDAGNTGSSNVGFTVDLPPARVANLHNGTVTSSSIVLIWNASSEADLNKYIIYRNDTSIGTSLAGTANYTDSPVNASTTYSYKVSAVDDAGNEGENSTEWSVTTPA